MAAVAVNSSLTFSTIPMPVPVPIKRMEHAKKHEEYYLEEGDVVIQVEETLFRLSLAALHARSPVLRIIMPPTYDGQKRLQGFNDASPFRLPGVSEGDFVKLLYVLCPLPTTPTPPFSTVDDWLSVLRLASLYEIDDIAPIASKHLHALHLDPVQKIVIWNTYKLDASLLVSSYVILCMRTKPLTLAMTMSLGLKTFAKVAAVRDEYHQRTYSCTCRRVTFSEKKRIAEELVKRVLYTAA